MNKRIISSLIISVIILTSANPVFAMSWKDNKYHDPLLWQVTGNYSTEELQLNNTLQWNIVQFAKDLQYKYWIPVKVYGDGTVEFTLRDNAGNSHIQKFSPDTNYDDIDTLNQYYNDLCYGTEPVLTSDETTNNTISSSITTDSSITKVSYKDAKSVVDIFNNSKLDKETKYMIINRLSENVLIDAFKDMKPNDQVLLMVTNTNLMPVFPIEEAMMEYDKEDLLEMWNAAKKSDDITTYEWDESLYPMGHFGNGSDFDKYRLMNYIIENQPEDYKLYKKMINAQTNNEFEVLRELIPEVLATNGNTDQLKTLLKRGNFLYFRYTELNFVFNSDKEFTDFANDTYKRVKLFASEMVNEFPKY